MDPRPIRPLWLSHHHEDQIDRCAVIGGHRVCRRCVWFWPAVAAWTVAALAGARWPDAADPLLLAVLPIPVVAEWWLEQLDVVGYAPVRQVLLSLLAAPAVGVGLARYLESPGDALFWTVVGLYALVCVAPVVIRWRRRTP